jgi:hypothetical protein
MSIIVLPIWPRADNATPFPFTSYQIRGGSENPGNVATSPACIGSTSSARMSATAFTYLHLLKPIRMPFSA